MDGFGITGVEGSFRRSSQVCMTVLRAQRSALVDVVEPLLYDPLVDWLTNQRPRDIDSGNGSVAPERLMARDALKTVDGRLKGMACTASVFCCTRVACLYCCNWSCAAYARANRDTPTTLISRLLGLITA